MIWFVFSYLFYVYIKHTTYFRYLKTSTLNTVKLKYFPAFPLHLLASSCPAAAESSPAPSPRHAVRHPRRACRAWRHGKRCGRPAVFVRSSQSRSALQRRDPLSSLSALRRNWKTWLSVHDYLCVCRKYKEHFFIQEVESCFLPTNWMEYDHRDNFNFVSK